MNVEPRPLPEAEVPGFTNYAELLPAVSERSVEVTDSGYEWLEKRGVTPEQIDRLAEIAGGYEYRNCQGKAEQVVERGAVFDGREVILPDYFDLADRKDGQCSEITAKVMRDMIDSGWLAEVNATLGFAPDSPDRLLPFRVIGQSRTHFNDLSKIHFWVGLGDIRTPPHGMLVVDGSFGEISGMKDNDYRPRETMVNPREFKMDANRKIEVQSYRERDELPVVTGTHDFVVMGVTENGAFSVSVGFVKSAATGEIHPMVNMLHATDSDASVSCLVRDNDEPYWFDGDGLVDDKSKLEVEFILRTLATTDISTDPDEVAQAKKARPISLKY